MSAPYTLRWGILSTGWISSMFAKDLLKDPKGRGVTDVVHVVQAVGSRTKESADKFIKDHLGGGDITSYATYEELVKDPKVDAIYVGTPHPMHYANTKLALNAGKHVLCEKPFTVNAAELKELLALAKSKKLFLMEAASKQLARFFPISYKIQKLIADGEIGDVRRVYADFGMALDLPNLDKGHRMIDPKLGGGALLDMGPYPLVWIMMTLFLNPKNERTPPKLVSSAMLKTPITGVDESTQFTFIFEKLHAMAIGTVSMSTGSAPDAVVRIQGSKKKEIVVPWPPFRPERYIIREKEKKDIVEEFEIPTGGHGMFYEADETARCIRDGKLESERMPHEESLMVQEWFDEIRKQGNLVYPSEK